MELEQKYKKHFATITVISFIMFIGLNAYAGIITVENYTDGKNAIQVFVREVTKTGNAEEQAIAGMIIGALIGVYVASVLLPLIANRTATLESNADLDENEQSLVSTWTLFIVLGVMGAIIGMAF